MREVPSSACPGSFVRCAEPMRAGVLPRVRRSGYGDQHERLCHVRSLLCPLWTPGPALGGPGYEHATRECGVGREGRFSVQVTRWRAPMRNVRRLQCQTRDAKVNGLMPLLVRTGGVACNSPCWKLVSPERQAQRAQAVGNAGQDRPLSRPYSGKPSPEVGGAACVCSAGPGVRRPAFSASCWRLALVVMTAC